MKNVFTYKNVIFNINEKLNIQNCETLYVFYNDNKLKEFEKLHQCIATL